MPDKSNLLFLKNARMSEQKDDFVDILIDGTTFAAIGDAGEVERPRGAREIDVDGRFVLPGLIDTHVHLGNGAQTLYEDISTESQMAVSGGVTTLLPYLVARDNYREMMAEFNAGVAEVGMTDMLPQLAIVSDAQVSMIPELSERYGVTKFKCFMGYKGGERTPSGVSGIPDADIVQLMREVSKLESGRLAIHCENMELIEESKANLQTSGRQDTKAWSESRPLIAEYQAIATAISYARFTNCAICIPHISFGTALPQLRDLAADLDVIFETCPHYLALTSDDDIGFLGKVNPPLRDASEQRELWRQLHNGNFDVIGTDHCPFDSTTKGDELWTARAGIANGPAVCLSVLMHGSLCGSVAGLDIERIRGITARNPAAAYGLSDRKGAIRVGLDADIVVFETDSPWTVRSEAQYGVASRTPYDERQFRTKVITTIIGGEVVYHEGLIESRGTAAKVL